MKDTFEIFLFGKIVDEIDMKRGTSVEDVKKYLVTVKGFSSEIQVRLAPC